MFIDESHSTPITKKFYVLADDTQAGSSFDRDIEEQ